MIQDEASEGRRCGSSQTYVEWLRRTMRRASPDHVQLVGSSFSEPVELLEQTLRQGLEDGMLRTYESVFLDGNRTLNGLLADYYEVGRDRVLSTTGASRALSLVYGAFVQPGERVLIERPCHDLFEVLARDRGLVVDNFLRRPDEGFEIDPEELERNITPQTRLVVLSNLHNPSGKLLDRKALALIAEVADRHSLLVVVDEVYLGYARDVEKSLWAAGIADNLITVNSLTKTHALSSLRCGWIIAAPEVMAPLRKYSALHEFGVSKFAHAVVALVLMENERYARHRQRAVARVKPLFDHYMGRLADRGLILPFLPGHGCIYFPVFTGIDNSMEFSRWLEHHKKVVVSPGECFGYAGAVRVGMPERIGQLEQALEAFCSGVEEYSAG